MHLASRMVKHSITVTAAESARAVFMAIFSFIQKSCAAFGASSEEKSPPDRSWLWHGKEIFKHLLADRDREDEKFLNST